MPKPKAEPGFVPFADEATVQTVGGLTIENGTSRIALHGSVDLTRDAAGLEQARTLRDAFARIVDALAAQELPERVAEAERAPGTVKNPFA